MKGIPKHVKQDTNHHKALLISLLVIPLGVLIGYYVILATPNRGPTTVYEYLYSQVNKDNIRKHLYKFTEEIGWKVAGTPAEHDAACYIAEHFRSIGLTSVKLVPYQVLLSYPDPNNLNTFEIFNKDGKILLTAHSFEDFSLPHVKNNSHYDNYIRSIFMAYSASGVVNGPIVNVNFARNEDFEKTEIKKNDICLARYGKIGRMAKAENAASNGCGGMVLYSHPEEYNLKGNLLFYPHSEYLPDTGVQRGTLKGQQLGDYLTPAYPSVPEAYRLKIEDADLPTIPFYVIRNDDVSSIFKLMQENEDISARLSIFMQNNISETNDVIGLIPGKEEPDRYVIIGNHFDSWGPGSIDPNIGSSIVMELSRVLMAYHNLTGWQPRRSILFCEWGSEEFGSLGSREFVEQFSKVLASRTVAYINTDVAVLGNYSVKFKSQPLLKTLIFNSTKSIPEPIQRENEPVKCLYDTYLEKYPKKKKNTKVPIIFEANTGSDYVHFIGLAGVPSLDIRYTYEESLGLCFYPLYHSAYENFHAFTTFIDPGFRYSEVITKVIGDLALKLASEAIIPYSVDEYVEHVIECILSVISSLRETEGLFLDDIIPTKLEKKTLEIFKAGFKFTQETKLVDVKNEMEVRALNDRMMLLQKAFLYEDVLAGRESVRNALHAPSKCGSQVCLAEINTMLREFNLPLTEKLNAKEEILKEIARIHHFIDTAISILDPHVLP